jgi:hypothetical protein
MHKYRPRHTVTVYDSSHSVAHGVVAGARPMLDAFIRL